MYSVITFTTGDKSLQIPLMAILGQYKRPKEMIIIHDTKWGKEIPEEVHRIANIYKHEGITLNIIRSKEKTFAGMKNFGYSHIKTPYTLYIEDDAWIPPTYASTLIFRIKEAGAGAIGGCQLLDKQHDDIVTPQVWNKIDIPRENLYQRVGIIDGRLEYIGMKHQLYRYKQEEIIPAQILIHTYLLNMEAFKEVKGWDDKAPESGSLIYEEVDVMLRMWLSGRPIKIDTSLVMWHIREISARRTEDKIDLNLRLDARNVRKLYFGDKFRGRL